MADSPYLVAVAAENNQRVVIEGSRECPVLVDFWAEWCAPCRSLMPILAKLAIEYGGRLIVAKLNTEEERDIATQFGIRSLPTVQLFKAGRAIDQFMGALPEAQVREFVEGHLPRESDTLLNQAETVLRTGDLAGAEALLEKARAMDPDNTRLLPARARIKAAAGNTKGAEEMLERLPLEIADNPEIVALRGQLRFANLAADAPRETDLAARLGANPNDSEARYQLAAHCVVRGDYTAALDELLTLLRKDRHYGEDAARKGMLLVFDLLGGEGALVSTYRAKMLNALY